MDRRQFLAALAAGGVVTAAGLWMPGQKLISIPKKRGLGYTVTEVTIGDIRFGNSILTPEMIVNEALESFRFNIQSMHTAPYLHN